MRIASAVRRHLGSLLLLAGPILLSQYAYLASSMADTVMSGRLGTVYQAGVAVGSAVWVPVQMFVTGILYSVMIGVSQHHGAGRADGMLATGRQGLWLALLLGLVSTGVLFLAAPRLSVFGVDEATAAMACTYLRHLAWGMPFSSLAIAMRFFCDGQKNVVPATVIAIIVVAVNIILNYGLMFGRLGLPAMDVAGCGLATGISMVLSMALFAVYVSSAPRLRGLRLLARLTGPSRTAIKDLAGVGLPVGVATVSEFLVLSVIAICVSTTGPEATAANQIACNFMMMLFAIPTCLAMAASIMVGGRRGAGDRTGEQETVITSVAAGLGAGLLLTAVMWFAAPQVAALYSHDQAVISLAASLLMIAALFQLVDAVQICLNGVLRGIEDTVVPFLVTSGVYWLVTLPLGYVLSGMPLPFGLNESTPAMGAAGWWTALVFGITLVALALGRRVRRIFFLLPAPIPAAPEAPSPDRQAGEQSACRAGTDTAAHTSEGDGAPTANAAAGSSGPPDTEAAGGADSRAGDRRRLSGRIRRHPGKSLAFALLLLAALWALLQPDESAQGVVVHAMEEVRARPLRHEFPVTGIIKPEEGAEVKTGSRFTGVIDTLHVRLGDAVTRGQVIAELDRREQDAECRRLEATIRKLRAELAMAEETYPLQIQETEALMDSTAAAKLYAQRKLGRASTLHRQSAISRDEAERIRQEADMASASNRQQTTARERIEAEYALRVIYLQEAIREAEAELVSADIRRSYATIVSPMDGVVSEITAQEGETLVAGLQVAYLVTVLDPKRLELQMFVDENDIGRVHPGTRVSFSVEAFRDRTFEGTVDLIHPGPEIRNNIVYYRALVRLAPETALQLRPEMTARCSVVLEERDSVLCVPNAAFKWIEDKKVVFVGDGSEVRPVVVRSGIEGLSHTEVVDGLEAGQKVATSIELPSPLPAEWLDAIAAAGERRP